MPQLWEILFSFTAVKGWKKRHDPQPKTRTVFGVSWCQGSTVTLSIQRMQSSG